MNPIVIVGAGLAGYTVAREIRKLDKWLPIMVVAADAGDFYSKPMLSNALTAGKSVEELVIKSADQMRTDLDCEVLTESEVTAISPTEHTLTVGARNFRYSSLVLALGADPIQLVLNGNPAPKNLPVNDLADYRSFRHRILGKERITILGAGLIGCEFANDLCNGGYQVNVIDFCDGPIRRFLPLECSKALQAALAGVGVQWHLGSGVDRISEAAGSVRVLLKNGTEVASDALLSAVGLRPRTGLARAAGIEVGQGIITDRYLRTSAPDVYALGDCAEISGLIMPFVLPIMHAARALAATLAGLETQVNYPPMPIVVKTPACSVVVAPAPPAVVGNWHISGNGAEVRAVCRDTEGIIRGFALVGGAVTEKNAIVKQMPMLLS
jgi:rubredoxin-NAD+ reductase